MQQLFTKPMEYINFWEVLARLNSFKNRLVCNWQGAKILTKNKKKRERDHFTVSAITVITTICITSAIDRLLKAHKPKYVLACFFTMASEI